MPKCQQNSVRLPVSQVQGHSNETSRLSLIISRFGKNINFKLYVYYFIFKLLLYQLKICHSLSAMETNSLGNEFCLNVPQCRGKRPIRWSLLPVSVPGVRGELWFSLVEFID